jgi:hypothetical protein
VATDLKDAAPAAAAPTDEDKRTALEQALRTASFLRADQLRGFLRFICDMEIAGRGEELSEYVIGVEALGRPSGYSPGEDPVVRRRAVHLREKLDEVYAGELREARLRIELPKGRYVPRFVHVEPSVVAETPEIASPAAAVARRQGRYGSAHLVAAFLAGAAAASAAFALWLRLPAAQREHLFEAGVTYEGEGGSNVFAGMARPVMGCPSCSGAGRARSIGNGSRNYVELVDVRATRDGEHDLAIHYLLDGERTFFVSVNGAPGVEVPLSGANWMVPSEHKVRLRLKAGRNTLRFYNEQGWGPDLDRIVVRE